MNESTRRKASIKRPLLDSMQVVSCDTLFACQSEMEKCVPRKILLQKRVLVSRNCIFVRAFYKKRTRNFDRAKQENIYIDIYYTIRKNYNKPIIPILLIIKLIN